MDKLLMKAFTAKTSEKRMQSWVQAQKSLKIKNKAVLAVATKAVKQGAKSKKQAAGITVAVIGARKRDYYEKEASKPSPPKTGVRKRGREEYSDSKKRKLSSKEEDFISFKGPKGENIGKLEPSVTKYILAGDVEGISARLNSLDALNLYNAKVTNDAMKISPERYKAVTDFIIDSTKVVQRLRACIHNDEQLRSYAQKINTYNDALNRGLSVDFKEVSNTLYLMINAYRDKQVKMQTVNGVDVGGSVNRMTKDVADAILEQRMVTEQIKAQEEATEVFVSQAKRARDECQAKQEEFNKYKKRKEASSTISNYAEQEKAKEEAEEMIKKASEEYKEAQTKADNCERLAAASNAAYQYMLKQQKEGMFGYNERKYQEKVMIEVTNLVQKAVKETQSSTESTKNIVNNTLNHLSPMATIMQKQAKAEYESLGDPVAEQAELVELNNQIKQGMEKNTELEGIIYDTEEDLEASQILIRENAKKRVTEGIKADTGVLREKVKNLHNRSLEAQRIKRENEAMLKNKEARRTLLESKRKEADAKVSSSATVSEQGSSILELDRTGNEQMNDVNMETLVQVQTIAIGTQQTKEMNQNGDSITVLEFNEDPIQDSHDIEQKVSTSTNASAKRFADLRSELMYWKERERSEKIWLDNNLNSKAPNRKLHQDQLYNASQHINETYRKLAGSVQRASDVKLEFEGVKDAIDDFVHQADVYKGTQAQTKIPFPTNIPSDPSFNKVVKELKLATAGTKGQELFRPPVILTKKSKSNKIDRAVGGFVVGKRPDPMINIDFWKNLYNKTK